MTVAFILKISCPDRPGIVARITAEIYGHGGNIVEANQFEDLETGRFFMRIMFGLPADNERALSRKLERISIDLDMVWQVRRRDHRPRILLLASKFDHCLVDLLYRRRIGELRFEIAGVVSNHPRDTYGDLGDAAFHYLPISKDTKAAQEAEIKGLVEDTGAELIVLARYMQILSDDLATYLAGRCINIHHSFLPGFKGAKPYHQAHDRGVKMIGATAHYVTADLDEGPIIAQDVEPVSHSDSPADLVRKGRDIERRVLARAVSAHIDLRVLINESRTVVFQ